MRGDSDNEPKPIREILGTGSATEIYGDDIRTYDL